jgi:hypothetical protein
MSLFMQLEDFLAAMVASLAGWYFTWLPERVILLLHASVLLFSFDDGWLRHFDWWMR